MSSEAEESFTVGDLHKVLRDYNRPVSKPAPGMKVESGIVGTAPYSPPIDLHPGVIEGIEGFKDFAGYLAPAQNAFSLAITSLKEIYDARQAAAKNRARTPEQVVLITASFAEKKQEAITRTFDKARNDLMSAANALDQSLSSPLEQQASAGSIPTEIRSYVSNLSTEERMKFMDDAIKHGRSKVLTSVLGAEPFLSGLSYEMHASLTRMYNEQRAPQAVARLKATQRAIDLIEQRGGLALVQVEKAMGGTWNEVKELRGMADAETKALSR